MGSSKFILFYLNLRAYPFLSHENFEKLNKETPERAAELHTYIVKLLSDRLAKSNATIQALM